MNHNDEKMTLNELAESLNAMMEWHYSPLSRSGDFTANVGHIKRVREQLEELDDKEFYMTISRCIREAFLTEKWIESGYGVRQACQFIEWFDHHSYLSNRKLGVDL